MSRDREFDGWLLRGTPPYPWWQWVLGGVVWGGLMFLIFGALTHFRDISLQAPLWAGASALATLGTRYRIVRRERKKKEPLSE